MLFTGFRAAAVQPGIACAGRLAGLFAHMQADNT